MLKKPDKPEIPATAITKAWKITIANSTFTGKMKLVQFFQGVGALCAYGFAAERPEWVQWADPHFLQTGGLPISELARYFRDRGCKVEEIDAEAGRKLYEEIARNSRDYVPPPPTVQNIEPEKTKAKADAKSGKVDGEVLPHESSSVKE